MLFLLTNIWVRWGICMPSELWGERHLRLQHVSFLGLFRPRLTPNLILCGIFPRWNSFHVCGFSPEKLHAIWSVWIWAAIAPSFWRTSVRRLNAFVEQRNVPWEEQWASGAHVLLFIVNIRMYSDISNINAKATFWGRKNVLLEMIW